MNVLLSAYACAPGRGSEPQIGWNWVREISANHPTWVLTRRKHQPAIEEALKQHPLPNAHFVYLDLPRWARLWKDLPGGVYVYYLVWQIMAYRAAKRLAGDVAFSTVQHVTFCMYWIPSLLPLLGIPFIWGPLGGGESAPDGMRSALPARARMFELFRDLGQYVAMANPLVRLAARRCTLALAGTPETAKSLKRLGCRNVQIIPVVGVTADDLREFRTVPTARRPSTFRVFSAGRLLHWKGHSLALSAIAEMGNLDGFEYSIFGDGPERARLEKIARSLGISKQVIFESNVSRTQLLRSMPEFDALLHPSLHDSGGFVCLEAMASGCPVICLDTGGPAVQMGVGTGMKIAVHSSRQAITDIARALGRLRENPSLRESMAGAGRQHVAQQLSFNHYMESLSAFYAPESSRSES